MHRSILPLFFILWHVASILAADTIETTYGRFDVEEPVLIELIQSAPFERLKGVRQYGISFMMRDKEPYTRYDHSLGVFILLRKAGCSLEEQIEGLLHDVSHTVFSHMGDYFFQHFSEEESYQDTIHEWFMWESGLAEILDKHGFSVNEVLAKQKQFCALEQPLPHLCADRLDYNLQGAFLRGWINQEEMMELFLDAQFDGTQWSFSCADLAEKLGRYSLYCSMHVWAGPEQHVANEWLSEALKYLIDKGEISLREIHFGQDDQVWNRLLQHEDLFIQQRVRWILDAFEIVEVVTKESGERRLPMKCRGIDPMIRKAGTLWSLRELSAAYKTDFLKVQAMTQDGHWIRLNQNCMEAALP